jgi:hypothetical protein
VEAYYIGATRARGAEPGCRAGTDKGERREERGERREERHKRR